MLIHVLDRTRVLDSLIASLRPGGWIVAEEFDAESVLPDPSVGVSAVPLKTGIAMRRLMTDGGYDVRVGRSLSDRFLARGLVDVRAEGTISIWRGGSPGSALQRANDEQLAEAMMQVAT